jgi:serine protease Do
MEKAKNSVVEITSETGGLFRSKPAAMKDPKTGRIFLASKVGGAKYTRAGAGIIIDQSGTIVTNNHTVEKASRIIIKFNNGQSSQATIIQSYPKEDIAFLKILDTTIKTVPVNFSKPTKLKLNTRIFSIGYSKAIKGTFSEGKITGIGKNMKSKDTELVDLIQINLNMYKGDSGGPLFNESGDFLGLLVGALQKKSRVSYAIPAPKIAKLYIRMISTGN